MRAEHDLSLRTPAKPNVQGWNGAAVRGNLPPSVVHVQGRAVCGIPDRRDAVGVQRRLLNCRRPSNLDRFVVSIAMEIHFVDVALVKRALLKTAAFG